ncbi:MAG: hypothetical protein N2Z72_01430 [Bacteroidales bacterium]|nr:hypothetical protein [Bacteroidales bacterium]
MDGFKIHLQALKDISNFLHGINQEYDGVIRDGVKLSFAFCEAAMPKIAGILLKSYGRAYIVVYSKNIGGDFISLDL